MIILSYCRHAVCTELIYHVKENFVTPTDKCSFDCKCFFHQKSEEMGERMSKERRGDKAQVERREGEKLYVDTQLARGEMLKTEVREM